MQAISDNMQSFHYIYDASGERVIKGMGMGQTIYINGFPMGTHSSIGAYTVSVSPFVVIRNFRMSKHFYMEGQRISTKLAKMRPDEYLLSPMDSSSLPSGSTWQAKQSAMEALLGRNIDSLMGNTNPTDSLSQPQGHLQSFFSGTDAPFSVGTANMPAIMDTLEKENSQYFYHSDHLGSTSYITNVNGDISQHIEYFPFGETFMEEHNATDEYSHYKFNGKELDEETGLYYYGARYYDPQISMWYGVDPLADKYPNVSAYVFVANNPINAIDLDGRKILFVNGHYQDNWVGRNIIGADKGGQSYWGNGFASAAQDFFNDYSNISSSNFIDGSSSFGGDMSGEDRYNAGMEYAKANIKLLTADMEEGETFKMVTHSEGSAYGAGIAQYLIDQGYKVETVAHLSADEGDEFSTPTEPMTYQLSYGGDWVTGNKTISGVNKSGIVNSDLGWMYVHGSTKSANVFKQLFDLSTVRTQDNIGMTNGVFNAWRTQISGSTTNGTDFLRINGTEIMNQDGTPKN